MAEIAGLKLIVPSSVAGSGVSLSGAKVTFTAATAANVNGCFSATYDNYLIVVRHVANSGDPAFFVRWRASGADATAANYTYQTLFADNTSVGGGRSTSDTVYRIGDTSSTQRSGHHIYVYGPYLAQPTASRCVTSIGANSAFIYDTAGTHSLSTAYDGFTIYPSAGNITGALTVYGLSQ